MTRRDSSHNLDSPRIRKRLLDKVQQVQPGWVHNLTLETGSDAQGDPAVWIWVEIDDMAAGQVEDSFNRSEAVRKILDREVRELDSERWPYVRFTTTSELQHASRGKI